MNARLEYLRGSIRFERYDRNMSLGIGIGFLALSGAGIWAIATGEPFGIVPALAGAVLGVGSFHEASEANNNIREFQARTSVIESR